MHKLMELNYTEWHKMGWTQWMYYRLMFAHPRSIDLLLAFLMVLIIDYTYKINRCQMPLFEIANISR